MQNKLNFRYSSNFLWKHTPSTVIHLLACLGKVQVHDRVTWSNTPLTCWRLGLGKKGQNEIEEKNSVPQMMGDKSAVLYSWWMYFRVPSISSEDRGWKACMGCRISNTMDWNHLRKRSKQERARDQRCIAEPCTMLQKRLVPAEQKCASPPFSLARRGIRLHSVQQLVSQPWRDGNW